MGENMVWRLIFGWVFCGFFRGGRWDFFWGDAEKNLKLSFIEAPSSQDVDLMPLWNLFLAWREAGYLDGKWWYAEDAVHFLSVSKWNGWCFGWPPILGPGIHTLKRMLQVSRYQHVGKHVCLTAWIQANFIMTMLRLSLLSNILCGSSDWKNQLNVECFPPPIVCYLKPCGNP